MMSSFTTPLIVKHHDDDTWTVMEPFTYDVGYKGSNESITVPEGFRTDFASVPRCLWWLYNPTGRWGKAAVVHDWLYANAGLPVRIGSEAKLPVLALYSRRESDRIFLEGMKVLGVRWSARRVMHRAVRAAGWAPWRRHLRANDRGEPVMERATE
jgi:hypothetical protein